MSTQMPLGLAPGQTFLAAVRDVMADQIARGTEIGRWLGERLGEIADEIDAIGAESPQDFAYRLALANGEATCVHRDEKDRVWRVVRLATGDLVGEVRSAADVSGDPSDQGWWAYRWTTEIFGGYRLAANKSFEDALAAAGHLLAPKTEGVACAS